MGVCYLGLVPGNPPEALAKPREADRKEDLWKANPGKPLEDPPGKALEDLEQPWEDLGRPLADLRKISGRSGDHRPGFPEVCQIFPRSSHVGLPDRGTSLVGRLRLAVGRPGKTFGKPPEDLMGRPREDLAKPRKADRREGLPWQSPGRLIEGKAQEG